MTSVLALDVASNTGWCVMRAGAVAASGYWDLDTGIPSGEKTGLPLHSRNALKGIRLRRNVISLVRAFEVDVIGVEVLGGRKAGTGLLHYLQGVAHDAAFDAGIASVQIDLQQWREDVFGLACGKRDDAKAMALEHCRREGISVANDDEADAVCIAQFMNDWIRVGAPPARIWRVPA